MRLFSSIAMVFWLFGALQMPARAQSQASVLIERLIHQSSSQPLMRPFSCGTALSDGVNYRTTALALSELGLAAIPDVEAALDSVEKKGADSNLSNAAAWLLYAKIKGPRHSGLPPKKAQQLRRKNI